jgi:hypothetical protein
MSLIELIDTVCDHGVKMMPVARGVGESLGWWSPVLRERVEFAIWLTGAGLDPQRKCPEA